MNELSPAITMRNSECARCADPSQRTAGSIVHWQQTCPSCNGPVLSDETRAELNLLSDSDRCSLASALGEPMLSQLSELAHDLRVSTMGEMVAGLAHELNQPLFAISNYARACENLLRQQPPDSTEFPLLAEKLVKQADRAAEIVRRLRRFVSRREPRRTRLDVNQLVREAQQLMLFHANRFSITMNLELATDLPPVLGDSLLIEQVLVNLVRNSFEAINEAKCTTASVTMRTRAIEHDEIEISVIDNGPGFGGAPLDQLFEAYYTTKKSGMGLGLVISRSIVHAHGGRLDAEVHPQGGAMFHLILPKYSEDG